MIKSRAIALAMLVIALAGCDAGTPTGAAIASAGSSAVAKPSGKTMMAELTGYNHTDKEIGAFYVNGQWGGNITPGSGGGKFVCCVDLPVPWTPGLKVTVSWEDQNGVNRTREVAVPQYDPKKAGGFNVHFLRSGEIKVFAGMTYLGHSDYPLKGEEAELKAGVPIKILPRD